MMVKKESKKAGLKFNIQNTKIMASGPITSWQLEGEKMETTADFNFSRISIAAQSEIRGMPVTKDTLGSRPSFHTKK